MKTVAFLGPKGTYTHQAAFEKYGNDAQYQCQETISGYSHSSNAVNHLLTAYEDVFSSLCSADIGVVPQENTIYGAVIETYDALRAPFQGSVCGEVTLEVQHCLIARKDTSPRDIKVILSHEQALGQCREFIASKFPGITLEKTTSTAAAAEALCTGPPNRAAICSEICLLLFPDLQVLEKGIQDSDINFTRFYLITKVPSLYEPLNPTCALLRISEQSGCARTIPFLNLPLRRIDRRPALNGKPFTDTYLVEVEQLPTSTLDWREEVQKAVGQMDSVTIMGFW